MFLPADRAVVVDHVDELLRLVAADRRIGNQHCVVRAAAGESQSGEQAGCEDEIRIAKNGPAAHRAGVWIEAIVDEVHVTGVRILGLLVGQSEVDGILALARAGPLAGGGQSRVFEECCFVGVEIAMDRIERHDRREQRRVGRAAAYQIAFGHFALADAAADWRREFACSSGRAWPIRVPPPRCRWPLGCRDRGFGGRDFGGRPIRARPWPGQERLHGCQILPWQSCCLRPALRRGGSDAASNSS